MNNGKKLFIVRKYIMARDASEAIRIDKITKPDDVFVDSEWKESHLKNNIGFNAGK